MKKPSSVNQPLKASLYNQLTFQNLFLDEVFEPLEVSSGEEEISDDSRLPAISEPDRHTFVTFCAGTVILLKILLLRVIIVTSFVFC